VIHDKAGAYRKRLFISDAACQSDDKRMRFLSLSSRQRVDDRADLRAREKVAGGC